jgi:hypothetical protein
MNGLLKDDFLMLEKNRFFEKHAKYKNRIRYYINKKSKCDGSLVDFWNKFL